MKFAFFAMKISPFSVGVHHENKAHFHRNALLRIVRQKPGRWQRALRVKAGVCLGIGGTVSVLQRLEVFVYYHIDQLAEVPKLLREKTKPNQHSLVLGVALRNWVLHLCPFLLVCHEPLERVVVIRLVHLQIPIGRQRKYKFPDSVQPLLHEGCGAVCFFCEGISGRRNKLSDPPVDFIKEGFIQIQNVHTALSNGVVLLAGKNSVVILL